MDHTYELQNCYNKPYYVELQHKILDFFLLI
jgi:hypothetical protein